MLKPYSSRQRLLPQHQQPTSRHPPITGDQKIEMIMLKVTDMKVGEKRSGLVIANAGDVIEAVIVSDDVIGVGTTIMMKK